MIKSETGLLTAIISRCGGLIFAAFFFAGCSVSKSSVGPAKKYPLAKMQKDYSVFQHVLEEYHPGLYWYTSKDSMDYFFSRGYRQLKDSMTESEFRKVLSLVVAGINCGHTSVRPSKKSPVILDSFLARSFPLNLKIWDDTAVVVSNLIRKDSVLKRGAVIKKINGKPIDEIIDTLSKYISSDGYNHTHKWQTLSGRGYFGSLYTSLFGISEKYNVEYIDSSGQTRSGMIPFYKPVFDSAGRSALAAIIDGRVPGLSRKERKRLQLRGARSLRIDSVNHTTAFMNLNTFSRGSRIKNFLRTSFKSLSKNKVEDLVIDLRSNGGGIVTNSTTLSRYLVDRPFKVADSLYAIKKSGSYGRYIQNNFFNRLFIGIMTRKKSDGLYHFGYFERHYFKPKKNNHFKGNVYIISGGNSFSATTLFISSLKNQKNVTVVGEETGGGAYGNSAWLIPDVTLPETRVRFRLPLFRLVIDKNYPKDGRGIQPDVSVGPIVEAIRRGRDNKMEKVIELIREIQNSKKNNKNQNSRTK